MKTEDQFKDFNNNNNKFGGAQNMQISGETDRESMATAAKKHTQTLQSKEFQSIKIEERVSMGTAAKLNAESIQSNQSYESNGNGLL